MCLIQCLRVLVLAYGSRITIIKINIKSLKTEIQEAHICVNGNHETDAALMKRPHKVYVEHNTITAVAAS